MISLSSETAEWQASDSPGGPTPRVSDHRPEVGPENLYFHEFLDEVNSAGTDWEGRYRQAAQLVGSMQFSESRLAL